MTTSAKRALTVLRAVSTSREPIGVTAIAALTDNIPGTTFRSLNALELSGFVTRYRSSTHYQLGPSATRLRHALYSQFGLRVVALPFMHRLAFATGETVSLVVPVGFYAVRIAVVRGSGFVRSLVRTGIVGPLARDPAGQIILASCAADYLDRYDAFVEHQRYGGEALTDRVELTRLCGAGLVSSHAQNLALPVRKDGATVGAIVVDGPVPEMVGDGERIDIQHCRAMIGELEDALSLLLEDADRLNPFDHIVPEKLILPVAD